MEVMAIIPKHFEMKDRDESEVVARLRIIAILLASLSFNTLKLR
jgi:UDP-N-acetylmuramyl pentapeptide phosphotransferase/UDP-N-acetylglucosamine-1-phosphate transferase